MTKNDDIRTIPRRAPSPAPPLPNGSSTPPLLLLLLFVAASISSLSDAAATPGASPLRDGDVDERRYLRFPIPNTVGRNHDGGDEDPNDDGDRDMGFEIPAVLEVLERDCEERFRKQRLVELDEYVTYVVLVATEYIVATAAGGEGAGAESESGATKQAGEDEMASNNVTDADDRDGGRGGGWDVTALRDAWDKSEEGTFSDEARHRRDFAERHALNAFPMLPDGTLRTFAGYACRYTRRSDGETKDFCRRYNDEGGINGGAGAASVLKELPRGSAIRLASVEGKTRRRRVVKELCRDPFSFSSAYSPSSTSAEGGAERDEGAWRRRWDEIVEVVRKYYVDKGLIIATTIAENGGEGEQELGLGQGHDNATATVNVGVNGSATIAAIELPPFTLMLLLRPSTTSSDNHMVVNGTILAGEASAMLSDVLSLHHHGNGTTASIPTSPSLDGSGGDVSTPGDDPQGPGRPEFWGLDLTASIVEPDTAGQGQKENENGGGSSSSPLLPRSEVVAILRGTAYYQRGDGDGRGAPVPVPSAVEMQEHVDQAFGADWGLDFVSRYLRLSSDGALRRVKRVYVRHAG